MRGRLTIIAAVIAHCAVFGQARFIENKGQWPAEARYQAELDGAVLWMLDDVVVFDLYDATSLHNAHANIKEPLPETLSRHAVRMRFLNAEPGAHADADLPLPGYHSYFIGNDRNRWASRAKGHAQVTLRGVAPGCDAVFRAGRSGAKYDLVVAQGADPASIRIAFEGADKVELRGAALVVHTSLGRLTERIPVAYQEIGGQRRTVHCRYTLRDGVVGFKTGEYDKRHPLIIDPTLRFATYSGSFSNNFGYTASFDQLGFLYAGSTAFGNQFPVTVGAYQTQWSGGAGQQNGGTDIAITKYDTTGSFLVWSTYLGGGGDEMPHSLFVDGNDQLVLLGTTGSSNFPTTSGCFDNSFGGGASVTPQGLGISYPNGSDMVVARLSADGSALIGSTYLGGAANDGLNTATGLKFNYADEVRGEVLLDAQGRVWVVSCTQTSNMPVTPGAAQPVFGGGSHDGYVARFNPQLTQLQYASYLGGSAADALYNGDLDSQGRLYVCGGTVSSNLPASSGAVQGSFNGGTADAFAARLSANGTAIERLTYWGSSGYDQAYFIELDQPGNAFLFGQTSAPSGQLIQNAPYNIPGGGQFISKLDPELSNVLLSSRVGAGDGTPDISPTAFLVDVCDKIYTSGWGSSSGGLGGTLTTTGLPVTPNAHQPTTAGHDLYLAVFDINMNALDYATYYGGGTSPEHVDGGTSRFDRRGRVYQSVCAGCQNNDDFPTTPGAWSATNNSSGCNNGLLKFDFDAPLTIAAFLAPDTVCTPLSVAFTNLSSGAASYLWDFGDTQTSAAVSPTHTYAQPGTYTVTLTATNPFTCNGQDVATRIITILPGVIGIQAMPDTLNCAALSSFTLTATGNGSSLDWHWSSMPNFIDVLNATPQDSTATIAPPYSDTFYVMATNSWGCSAIDSTVVRLPFGGVDLFAEGTICAGDTITVCVRALLPPFNLTWSPTDVIVGPDGTHCILVAPPEETTMHVDATASFGCTWSDDLTITVSPLAASSVTATAYPSVVVAGTMVQLQATPSNGVSYWWQPAGLVSNDTIANPTAVVNQTTTFTVIVSDGICTRAVQILVRVRDLICEEPDIFVPNTFTPNGDGVNDVLFVRGAHIDRMEFMVFDRWGEKVFESDDKQNGWSGHFKGQLVDPAVFVYHLKVWCIDGQEYFTKGNVTVVR